MCGSFSFNCTLINQQVQRIFNQSLNGIGEVLGEILTASKTQPQWVSQDYWTFEISFFSEAPSCNFYFLACKRKYNEYK